MQRVVFSDFDGTITAAETFSLMARRFTPQLTEQLLPEIVSQRMTLREGVRRIVESIPTTDYADILAFVRGFALRPGFVELLDFLDENGVELVVVSSGLRGMVETALGPLQQRVSAIHALDVDTNGGHLAVRSDFESGTELLAKVDVMRLYPAEEQVAIGDSITDVNMALHASLAFARDHLQGYLDERGHPYQTWDDFTDVRDTLALRWGVC